MTNGDALMTVLDRFTISAETAYMLPSIQKLVQDLRELTSDEEPATRFVVFAQLLHEAHKDWRATQGLA